MAKASNQGITNNSKISEENLQPAEISIKRKEKLKTPNIIKGALKKLDRQLTDKELESSGVSKLLLDRIDILEDEIKEAKFYIDNYHKLNIECAVLKKEVKKGKKFKFLNESCLTLGGAIFGLAFTNTDNTVKVIMIFFGVIFIFLGAILSYLLDKDE